jgi:hypothetical protein
MNKIKYILIIGTTGRGHLINPAQVSSITCTGGTIKTGESDQAVVEIAMAGGERIAVTGFGDEEADALENVAIHLNGEAS